MNLSSNRINQNAPRNNRPVPNRAPAPRPSVQQANQLSNYGTTTRVKSVQIGQIIRGEVSDLRNTEIVVTLENNTTVAGHLENGSWLAIGETAAFKVLSASTENIVLEALPKKDMSLAGSTVQKALEEAHLPLTEKNQQIVLELMRHQLPIHKQAILNILQQSYANKDIRIPTLVLMNKQQIPITAENALQLEHYQNNEHALSNHIYSLVEELAGSIKEAAANIQTIVSTIQNPLEENIEHATPVPETEHLSPKDALLQQLMHTNQKTESADKIFPSNISKLLSAVFDVEPFDVSIQQTAPVDDTILFKTDNDQQELLSILENFDLPEDIRQDIENNTASLRQVMKLIQEDYVKAQSVDRMTTEDTMAASEEEPVLLRTSVFESPVVKELENQFQQLQQKSGELGGKFSLQERAEFFQLLKDVPMDQSVKDNVLSGDIQTTALLRTLKNVLPFTPLETAEPLLASDTFEQIVKDELLQAFLLQPQDIGKEGGVNSYYKKLSKQLDNLEEFYGKDTLSNSKHNIEQILSTAQTNPKEQVSSIKNNLDFMKLLNQFFSYVQLPVKLQEKCTHADLYVYTRKKKLQQSQNPIHVLLHLDMEQLGTMDIDIHLKDRHVTTKFSMSDEKSGKLLANNFHLLENALLEKGYTCTTEMANLEKPVDLINDFLEPERVSQGISRYSFDLRA